MAEPWSFSWTAGATTGLDMKLQHTQTQRQTQTLTVTPQLQQAIKLLQLNHIELVEQIQQELMENPTLEEVPGSVLEGSADVERAADAQVATMVTESNEQANGTGE